MFNKFVCSLFIKIALVHILRIQHIVNHSHWQILNLRDPSTTNLLRLRLLDYFFLLLLESSSHFRCLYLWSFFKLLTRLHQLRELILQSEVVLAGVTYHQGAGVQTQMVTKSGDTDPIWNCDHIVLVRHVVEAYLI